MRPTPFKNCPNGKIAPNLVTLSKDFEQILSALPPGILKLLWRFQAAIRDSGNSIGQIAAMLDVDKKDLVDALVTRVIAANNEVLSTQFDYFASTVQLLDLGSL